MKHEARIGHRIQLLQYLVDGGAVRLEAILAPPDDHVQVIDRDAHPGGNLLEVVGLELQALPVDPIDHQVPAEFLVLMLPGSQLTHFFLNREASSGDEGTYMA